MTAADYRAEARAWRTPQPGAEINNGPLTMAMIEDIFLTIATAQGPWVQLVREDDARAARRGGR